MAQRPKPPDGLLGSIWGAIPFRIGGFTATIIMALGRFICILLALTGVMLWPFLLSCLSADAPISAPAGRLVTSGVAGLAASLLASILFAFLSHNFRFSSCFVLAYASGLAAVIIGMILTGANVLGVTLGEYLGGSFMLIMVHGILALLLALMPALISAGAALLVWKIGNALTGRGGAK